MKKLVSRRDLLFAAPFAACSAFGQMATRGIPARPRPEPSHRPYAARFTDVAAAAGLREPVIYGAADRSTYILETIGCGIALFDYDNDGWLDILVLCGTRLDGDPPGASNRLYRNNRDATFNDVTERAGLIRTGWATGVTIGDYNNDGYEDVFITYWGENVLYRNNGDGTFTDVTRQAGLIHQGRRWGTGCTFVDYNCDGLLDLFVSHYAAFDPSRVPPPAAIPAAISRAYPSIAAPAACPPMSAPYTGTTVTELSRMSAPPPA